MVSRRLEVALGVRDSLAAGLGMFPLGIAFGLLVLQSGLPWWVAPALSVAGFAGSLELLLTGMMVVTTPLATIALTAFLVNFRGRGSSACRRRFSFIRSEVAWRG